MAEAIFFERPVEKKETKTWCRQIKGSKIVTYKGCSDRTMISTDGPCVGVHAEGENISLQIVPRGREYQYEVRKTPKNGVRLVNANKRRPLPYAYMANWDWSEHV